MTEFEKILNQVLDRQQGTAQPEPDQSQKTGTSTADFLTAILFNFTGFKVQTASANVYNVQRPQREKPRTEQSTRETTREDQPPRDHRRPGQNDHKQSDRRADGNPRRESSKQEARSQSSRDSKASQTAMNARKKWSHDQLKALRVFFNFGASEINENSSEQEIRSAYKKLAKKYHPDSGAKNDDFFKTISAAYHKLTH